MKRQPPKSTLFPTRLSSDLFKASLFLAAGWVLHVTESRFMDEMGGLAKAMRLTSASMLLRSEEHTSELQSRRDIVSRLLLEKKNRLYIYTVLLIFITIVI